MRFGISSAVVGVVIPVPGRPGEFGAERAEETGGCVGCEVRVAGGV